MAATATTVTPDEVVRRIGTSNEAALDYVADPDAQLARLSRKVREALLPDLPPVTAGALLGPDALARHFIASAAHGRYRDLFALWELFVSQPEQVKPVLAERQRALEKGRGALATAVRLGLRGHAQRVAEDVARASGLIWQWLREALMAEPALVAQRPAVASALLLREPDLELPLPAEPDTRWLAEAAEARTSAVLAAPVDALLAAGAGRLPATVATLQLAAEHYPERVPALIDRVDLDSPDIGALMAWARDHGQAPNLSARVQALVEEAAARDRAEGLARWHAWQQRGMDLSLPDALLAGDLSDLDITRPETAVLLARLRGEGFELDPMALLDDLAQRNRQAAEKAYEAMVCAGLDVHLPLALEGNPLVKDGTRCPACQAWTYVRAGHERRCPRRAAEATHAAHAPQAAESAESAAATETAPSAPASAPAEGMPVPGSSPSQAAATATGSTDPETPDERTGP